MQELQLLHGAKPCLRGSKVEQLICNQQVVSSSLTGGPNIPLVNLFPTDSRKDGTRAQPPTAPCICGCSLMAELQPSKLVT